MKPTVYTYLSMDEVGRVLWDPVYGALRQREQQIGGQLHQRPLHHNGRDPVVGVVIPRLTPDRACNEQYSAQALSYGLGTDIECILVCLCQHLTVHQGLRDPGHGCRHREGCHVAHFVPRVALHAQTQAHGERRHRLDHIEHVVQQILRVVTVLVHCQVVPRRAHHHKQKSGNKYIAIAQVIL